MYQVPRSMGLVFSDLRKDKIFKFGLFFKLALILVFIPEIQTNWFTPFVSSISQNLSLDPWTNYLDQGGDPSAFPYGPIMF